MALCDGGDISSVAQVWSWMQPALNACTGCPSSRAPSWLVGVGVVLVVGNDVVLATVVAIVLFFMEVLPWAIL